MYIFVKDERGNPTGINTDSIYWIEKLDDGRIYFNCFQGDVYKTFAIGEEQDNYFDYIASKLEAVDCTDIFNN